MDYGEAYVPLPDEIDRRSRRELSQVRNGLRAGAKGMRTVGPANEVSLEFRGGVSSICSMPEQLDDRNPTHHT